jgi:hypothetical protein
MAKVWFVRRRGGQWIAPGGVPVFEAPLQDLVFKLDIGTHRWLSAEHPTPAPELAGETPNQLTKVVIQTDEGDLRGQISTAFRVGFYDSPYSPREVARRLGLTID